MDPGGRCGIIVLLVHSEIGEHSNSTEQWNEVPRGTMDEASSLKCLDLPSIWRQGRFPDCSASSSNPMMERPWCRFRREARARERQRHYDVDSLKCLTLSGRLEKHFIAEAGWRHTHIGIGIFCMATMLPLALVLRRRPVFQKPAMEAASTGSANQAIVFSPQIQQ